MLKKYSIEFSSNADGFGVFDCLAESKEHAVNQCTNLYPDALIQCVIDIDDLNDAQSGYFS